VRWAVFRVLEDGRLHREPLCVGGRRRALRHYRAQAYFARELRLVVAPEAAAGSPVDQVRVIADSAEE
jgi:hypothetical protein